MRHTTLTNGIIGSIIYIHVFLFTNEWAQTFWCYAIEHAKNLYRDVNITTVVGIVCCNVSIAWMLWWQMTGGSKVCPRETTASIFAVGSELYKQPPNRDLELFFVSFSRKLGRIMVRAKTAIHLEFMTKSAKDQMENIFPGVPNPTMRCMQFRWKSRLSP